MNPSPPTIHKPSKGMTMYPIDFAEGLHEIMTGLDEQFAFHDFDPERARDNASAPQNMILALAAYEAVEKFRALLED